MHYPSTNRPARKLHRFHGGLHLPDNKAQSNGRPVEPAALPKQLTIPLQQHIGEVAHPLVSVGDRVLKGQMIARAQGYISAPVHASSSGTVIEIGEQPVPHPSGLSSPCIVIETDGLDEWVELPEPVVHFAQLDPSELRERIRNAGIVGMGGAAFPTSVKVTPGPETWIKTLVLNGAECEPFITCDDMLMREQADRVLAGVAILQHLLEPEQTLIGIEDNKPEAIAAMNAALETGGLSNTEVVPIPTLYPSGGEKQLIRILTGKEVPSHGIPAQIGIVCHNVGTAAAIADAVLENKPLISRYVTIAGEGIKEPRNLEVLIGTPASSLIGQAGGYTDAASKLILGGPMMGFTLHTDNVPITKAANCLLAASEAESPNPGPASPCIRCGQCAAACPARLLPQQMYWYAKAKDLEKAQEYNLFDCIECGCCSHVCPSHIPLVQYFRFAKMESWAREQEKRKSEHARKRHEARVARLERLEAERKARLSKKKAGLKKKTAAKKAGGEAKDPKKAAIEAAMKRAAEKKAKLAEEGVAPKNVEELTEAQQKQIDQADKRRAEAAEDTKQATQEPEDA
ncbi:electron transport complex subunit RsxC [Solemya velesiana gill symbiont]|uniref:Ion-translocating oxidoreductase complex subunit C n=1 Tax=Solemya velesiana gill symbiont TaxID=1918948 RepID=A0A1T2KUT4_9GAMM|nr:electron transport complex subunit RsxC [Solemya velesiana gill symbiont]OOZ36628.1 electron transport complex subunit RsxC [Solemya velesiana gill symbiont]